MPPQSMKEDIYVPRDEAFSDSKQQAFKTKTILAGVHLLDEAIKLVFSGDKNASFPSLAAIDALFEDGFKNMPPPKEEGNKVHSALFNVLKAEMGNLMKGDLDKIIDFETPENFQSTRSIILLTSTIHTAASTKYK
jgi:lipoxygenase